MNKQTYQNIIYFAQCDTTAGLLSQNPKILNECKSRPNAQPLIMQVDSLATLKTLTRIPQKHKNRIRKAQFCTFLYPNKKAFRVVCQGLHTRFFTPFKALYSTSANPTGMPFDRQWAETVCDVIVRDKRDFAQGKPSHLYQVNHRRIQRRR